MNVLANAKVMTEAEKRLSSLLFDEGQQVLSTFEMNQIASLSYENETCEQIFDMLELVMGHPMKFTVLAVQKSIFVAKHVLIYGSEKCVNSCWGLSTYVEQLCKFNTVLLAQKQQGIGSWWQSVKGGGVDKGFPVREASENLRVLLADAPRIQQLRHDNADPNSLVPVGSNDKVAFVSDEVRHYMLNKRMEEHALLHTRSNLVKSSGGFGSGYNSSNGQSVVGAAHSMDEMLKRAERETKKFSDSGPVHYKPKPPPKPVAALTLASPAPPVDLLDFTASSAPLPIAPEVDLLGFGGGASAPAAPAVLDIFSPAAPAGATNQDLLRGDLLGTTAAAASESTKGTDDLLSLMVASMPGATDINLMNSGNTNGLMTMNGLDNGLGTMPLAMTIPESAIRIDAKPSVMASNVDHFAALDVLSPPAPAMTKLSGIEAENRILSFSNGIPILPSDAPPQLPTEAPPLLPTQAPPPPPSSVEAFMGGAPMGGMEGMGDATIGGAPMGGMGDAMMGMGNVMGGAPVGNMSMINGEARVAMGGAPMGSMPSFGGMGAPPLPNPPPPLTSMPIYDDDAPLAGTTMGVAAIFGAPDEEDDGFLMGGSSGAGLVPMGSMPSAPPPPPPPS